MLARKRLRRPSASSATVRPRTGRWTRRAAPSPDTATLVFEGANGGPAYTIEFITRHPFKEPVPAPGVVDMVVTQLPLGDEKPEMTLRVDSETVPVITRVRGRRSVVASLPLAEFDRIVQAVSIVDRTFNMELEFGAGQVHTLRRMADEWLGRVR